jgi:hypothetical protein
MATREEIDKLYRIFNDEVLTTVFAIKKYSMKDLTPSRILYFLENNKFEEIENLHEIFKISNWEIGKFKNRFKDIEHIEDYNTSKKIYELYERIEKMKEQKK